jgi:hypothetical protein
MKVLPRGFGYSKAKFAARSLTVLAKERKLSSQQFRFSESLVLLKCFANRITKDLFFGPQGIEAQSEHLAAVRRAQIHRGGG